MDEVDDSCIGQGSMRVPRGSYLGLLATIPLVSYLHNSTEVGLQKNNVAEVKMAREEEDKEKVDVAQEIL